MNINKLTPLVLIILLNSCNGLSNQVADVVKYWQGREIELPPFMKDVITGDTIDLTGSDFTILTYVDNNGCNECKMNLSLWDRYLNSLDTICNSNINFLMIVNTKDSSELRATILNHSFKHNIFMDSKDSINIRNKFPQGYQFHTFLLSKNKIVLTIGNPTNSSGIRSLYNSIISGRITPSNSIESTVFVSDNCINLGILSMNNPKTVKIMFSNKGMNNIRINKIISSCDCVDLQFASEIIPQNSSIKATLNFKGDSIPGYFERTIHIYYYGFEYPTILNISGNIIK